MTGVAAFLVGLAFALGLGLGGMTQPARVLGFLDVAGDWDPSLVLVMAGAIAVYGAAFPFVMRRRRPLLAATFQVPARRDVDGRLVVGALVFGVGWGLAGLCPGPALTALASGDPGVAIFVGAMLGGMAAHRLAEPRAAATAARAHRPEARTGRSRDA
ncbi:MAG: YeeE/YedE family protein [Deltaproteobacteria bacterium]|nr:YeeE/YedE family protein [Deltaproteobacteria bacterium]